MNIYTFVCSGVDNMYINNLAFFPRHKSFNFMTQVNFF